MNEESNAQAECEETGGGRPATRPHLIYGQIGP
jgi:hypothetical protein